MGLNKGYLSSDRSSNADECYTPFYAVEPIIKYIPSQYIVWCPFDDEWSAFVQLLKEKGYKVIHSSITDGQDFFNYEPVEYDCIVSNPPFSKKNKVLQRLDKLGKPFMMLLPLTTLQGGERFKYLKNIQLLCFDRRIAFYTDKNRDKLPKGNHFASCYFCKNILPKDLILEQLVIYERPIMDYKQVIKGGQTSLEL